MNVCTAQDWEKNTRSLNWQRVRVHDKLVALIQDVAPSGSLLEIGAQAGIDAEHLANLGHRVTAVDYNDAAIEFLKQRRNLAVVKGDGLRLPFSDDAFDVVYSQGLIEHYVSPDLDILVREQVRVAKPGKYVIIDVPNTFSLNTIPKQILISLRKWIVPWETQYTLRQLRDLGERNGLTSVRHYAWGYDRFIGERAERAVRAIFGESFTRFEESKGHYFMKCIGVVFQKPEQV